MSDLLELPNYDVISNYSLVTPQSRGPDKEKVFSTFFAKPFGLKRFPPAHPVCPLTGSPISWQQLSVQQLGYHITIVARGLPSQGRAVAGETG